MEIAIYGNVILFGGKLYGKVILFGRKIYGKVIILSIKLYGKVIFSGKSLGKMEYLSYLCRRKNKA